MDANQRLMLFQSTILKQDTGNGERFVLISDDNLIASFDGATVVDGAAFGYRTSALGFDTVGGAGVNMTGSLSGGLNATLTIGGNDPVHPYKHRYHPDHDGLDPQYAPQAAGLSPLLEEVWEITQQYLDARRRGKWLLNTSNCFSFQRPCEYLPFCQSGFNPNVSDNLYEIVPPHEELTPADSDAPVF